MRGWCRICRWISAFCRLFFSAPGTISALSRVARRWLSDNILKRPKQGLWLLERGDVASYFRYAPILRRINGGGQEYS